MAKGGEYFDIGASELQKFKPQRLNNKRRTFKGIDYKLIERFLSFDDSSTRASSTNTSSIWSPSMGFPLDGNGMERIYQRKGREEAGVV
jgi:hypothetical protein